MPMIEGKIYQAAGPLQLSGVFTTAKGSAVALNATRQFLGLSWGALGKLLATPNPSRIYAWKHARARPSSMYLTRLLVLIDLKARQGVDLADIDKIDWESGLPTWKTGDKKKGTPEKPRGAVPLSLAEAKRLTDAA